jgi:hypothetical protein
MHLQIRRQPAARSRSGRKTVMTRYRLISGAKPGIAADPLIIAGRCIPDACICETRRIDTGK